MLLGTQSRPDMVTSRIVEAGVAAATTLGKKHAANSMLARGVRFSVVVRVLAEPTRRRKVACVLEPESSDATHSAPE